MKTKPPSDSSPIVDRPRMPKDYGLPKDKKGLLPWSYVVDLMKDAKLLSKASREKYGFALKPEDYEKGGVFVFRPLVVIAWKKFPKDATRWRFSA